MVIVCVSLDICLTALDTACVHNKLRGKWYVFDDSRVSVCDDTSVVVSTYHLVEANFQGRAGYILWYKRNNQF